MCKIVNPSHFIPIRMKASECSEFTLDVEIIMTYFVKRNGFVFIRPNLNMI